MVKRTFKTGHERMKKRLDAQRIQYYIRESTNFCEIMYDNNHYIYVKDPLFKSKFLFIFNMVSNDVKEYLQKNKEPIMMPPRHHVNFYNYNYDNSHGVITGTDARGAYWTIAKNLGFISEKTYLKGFIDIPEDLKREAQTNVRKAERYLKMEDDIRYLKVARNAALSTLGTEKKFNVIKDGKLKDTKIVRTGDDKMRDVYTAIRLNCYNLMYQIAELLGEDFESWKTDCIYYRDTEANRKKVQEFLSAKGFEFKQLVFDTEELKQFLEQQDQYNREIAKIDGKKLPKKKADKNKMSLVEEDDDELIEL